MEGLLFGFFLIAVAMGFALGNWRASRRGSDPGKKSTHLVRQRYLEGLNQLLNEQQDAAIDIFVANLEVNNETLETHFALGGLLRKRGEVDRAIRIHQNLLARPSLSAQQQEQAQVELALDYRKSGLLDRAEALFTELAGSSNTALRVKSLENLVQIYQEEQEWEKAINIAEALCQRKFKSDTRYWRHLQSHFCCELADLHLQNQSLQQAAQWTKRALRFERNAVRPALTMCELELRKRNPTAALRWLNIAAEDPDGISVVIPLATECYRQLGKEQDLQAFLERIYPLAANPSVIPVMADIIFDKIGSAAALQFLQQKLQAEPQMTSLAQLLALIDKSAVKFEMVKSVVEDYLPPIFRCGHCGFEGQQLHWSCPTCKTWL